MKIIAIVFVLLLGLCASVAAAYFLSDDPFAGPIPHPTYSVASESGAPSMLIGGERGSQDAKLWFVGTLSGLLVLLICLSCVFLGAGRALQKKSLMIVMLLSAMPTLLVFVGIMLTYKEYVAADAVPFLGPFPVPTSLSTFGLLFAPVLYVFVFVFGFEKYFVTREDIQEYEQMLSENDKQDRGAA